MMLKLKQTAGVLAATVLAAVTTAAWAADPVKDYPNKPVRMIAPFTPGAGTDTSGLSSERTINVTVTARTFNRADVNGDGAVDASDLSLLLNGWGGTGLADLNLDGLIDAVDLGLLLAQWGS